MKGLSLFTFILLSVSAQAQMRECRIVSTDSVAFLLEVDGALLSDSALFRYDFLVENDEFSVNIQQTDSLGLALTTNLTPEKNMQTVFDLRKVNSGLVLLETSRTSLAPLGSDVEELILVTDSLLDSLPPPPPVDPGFYNLLRNLSREFFESERQKAAIDYSKDNPLTTSQLSSILSFFEFEDRKLTIIRSVRSQVTDFDQNWSDLKSAFVLKSSLQELSSLTQQP
ncbi:MAG: hypothetical protein ACI84C_002521 [Flavobacteriales bacterium]|jgi:hypothetical protein